MTEKREYSGGAKAAGMRGPGMRGGGERARDFTGTWKKLILYCRKYYVPPTAHSMAMMIGT